MIIYKITNIINNKIYIGKTVKSISQRFYRHKYGASKKINCRLYDSMNHYGYENFYIEQIDTANNDEELSKKEMYWIAFYDTTNPEKGYNMTVGGSGGDTNKNKSEEELEEIRLKRSESLKKSRSNESLEQKNIRVEKFKKTRQNKSEAEKIREYRNRSCAQSNGNNPQSKRVLCIETQEIFLSMKEAAIAIYGNVIARQNIRISIKNSKKVRGFSWKIL